METWYKTCGLSNLHIKGGDKVYVFLLEKNSVGTDRCYTTAFYNPLLLPFNSIYNETGGGEGSSGVAFPVIMGAVARDLVEMEVGENEYRDIAVKKDGFWEDEFFEAVHEHRLFTKGYGGEQTELSFTMFRKDIVDDILLNYKFTEYVGAGNGDCGSNNCYVKYGFDDILLDIPAFINKIIEDILLLRGNRYSQLNRIHEDPKNTVVKILRGFSNYRYLDLVPICEEIVDSVSNGKLAVAQELFTEYIKGVFLDKFMSATRRVWMPSSHEGAQSQDSYGYLVLNRAIESALALERADCEND